MPKQILSDVEADGNYFWSWVFSDEATFCALESVNCYNCRYEDHKTLTLFEKSKEILVCYVNCHERLSC
jgi:hypothetical protein